MNCSGQVNLLGLKKKISPTAELKSKPLLQSNQQVEQYIPLTITPADCYKHFQFKQLFGEYI